MLMLTDFTIDLVMRITKVNKHLFRVILPVTYSCLNIAYRAIIGAKNEKVSSSVMDKKDLVKSAYRI